MNIIISALRTTYRVIMEGLKKLMEETARKRKGLQDRGPKVYSGGIKLGHCLSAMLLMRSI